MSEVSEAVDVLLEEVDQQIGTRLRAIVQAARTFSPLLHDVIVIPFEQIGEVARAKAHFTGDPQTMFLDDGRSFITFSTQAHTYQPYLDGFLHARFERHTNFVSGQIGRIGAAQIIDICIAHELGHARDMADLVALAGVNQAFHVYMEEYKKEIGSLPLALQSSQAARYWRHNTGGYRTYLQTTGYTDVSFDDALVQNIQAYRGLPHEYSADTFALSIIEEVYGSAGSTT